MIVVFNISEPIFWGNGPHILTLVVIHCEWYQKIFNIHVREHHVVVTATDGVFVIGGAQNTAGKVWINYFSIYKTRMKRRKTDKVLVKQKTINLILQFIMYFV